MKEFIHSRPKTAPFRVRIGFWPLSIPLRETAGFSLRSFIFVTIGAFLIFCVVMKSTMRFTDSDPLSSLLVSQSIISDGTFKLDKYMADPDFAASHPYQIYPVNGHYYYFSSTGPAIFSIPFVWIANLFGKDMSNKQDDMNLQIVIAAILCAMIYAIIYNIARFYLPFLSSFVITTVSFMGSSLISTMGSGLWNFDFVVLFECLILLLLVSYDTGKSKSLNPLLLGFLLFAVYFCRPQPAFIFSVSLYILIKNKELFKKMLMIFLIFLEVLIIFSLMQYRETLHSYYYLAKFSGSIFLTAFYGHLFSPSRGLLVYSPFFIMILSGIFIYFSKLKKNLIFILALSWFFLHFLMISFMRGWWGGWAYGSRLLTDAIPALVLITILLWQAVSKVLSYSSRKKVVLSYIILGMLGIFLNVKQGLYNSYAKDWHGDPNPNAFRRYIFSWRYPQFLASEKMLEERLIYQQKNFGK